MKRTQDSHFNVAGRSENVDMRDALRLSAKTQEQGPRGSPSPPFDGGRGATLEALPPALGAGSLPLSPLPNQDLDEALPPLRLSEFAQLMAALQAQARSIATLAAELAEQKAAATAAAQGFSAHS